MIEQFVFIRWDEEEYDWEAYWDMLDDMAIAADPNREDEEEDK